MKTTTQQQTLINTYSNLVSDMRDNPQLQKVNLNYLVCVGEELKDNLKLNYIISSTNYESNEDYVVSNEFVNLNDKEGLTHFFDDYILNDIRMRYKDYLDHPQDIDNVQMEWFITSSI